MNRENSPSTPAAAAHSSHSKRTARTPHWAKILLIVIGVVAVLLIVAQLVISPFAKNVVNRKLAQMPGYRGQIGSMNLALWRGGGEAGDIVIYDRSREKDLPVVRVKKMAWKIATPALLSGKLEGETTIEGAEFNIVKEKTFAGPIDAAKQAKEKVKETKNEAAPWQDALRKTFPVEITRMEIKDSKIRFIDRAHQPNVDVAINNLHVIASGLRNRTEGDALPAKMTMEGVTTGNGQLKVWVQADPMSKTPRFTEKMELKNLSLPPVNSFLLAYSGVDVSAGSFDFYNEAKAEGGGYNGYVKPFLRDVNFKTASDKDKPVVERVAKTVANAAVGILKNKDEQKVATQAPFSGNFNDNNVDLWTTIDNLLRNAFLQALREGFSGQHASG